MAYEMDHTACNETRLHAATSSVEFFAGFGGKSGVSILSHSVQNPFIEKEPGADLNVRHATHDQSKEESNPHNNAISNPDWQRCQRRGHFGVPNQLFYGVSDVTTARWPL